KGGAVVSWFPFVLARRDAPLTDLAKRDERGRERSRDSFDRDAVGRVPRSEIGKSHYRILVRLANRPFAPRRSSVGPLPVEHEALLGDVLEFSAWLASVRLVAVDPL